jgi:hypothetical protein
LSSPIIHPKFSVLIIERLQFIPFRQVFVTLEKIAASASRDDIPEKIATTFHASIVLAQRGVREIFP